VIPPLSRADLMKIAEAGIWKERPSEYIYIPNRPTETSALVKAAKLYFFVFTGQSLKSKAKI
jgi:hypothetical protein